VQALGKKVGSAINGLARKVGAAVQRAVQATSGVAKTAKQVIGQEIRWIEKKKAQIAQAMGQTGGGSTITQVTIQDGAATVTTLQNSRRIDPSSGALQAVADGRIEPSPASVAVHAPDPSKLVPDLVRNFGAPGSALTDAGVYVIVHDGAVSLAQANVEIVLVKGETGFASADNKPPQLLDSPPPVFRHDRLLGDAGLFGQMCRP
jgi:hypothetical protein